MVSTSSRVITPGQWFVLLLIMVAIAGGWRWFAMQSEDAERSSTGSDTLSDVVSEPVDSVVPSVPKEITPITGRMPDGTLFVEYGAALNLNREDLSENEPLSIELRLDVPWFYDVNQPPRIVAPDRRMLVLNGEPQAGDQQRIRIKIPSNWLSTGRHVLELKTNERNHMPFRRYSIEVEGSNSE